MKKITNLRYVAECPKSSDGKHHMRANGRCRVDAPNGDVRYGQEGQCRDCYLIVATENNLFVYPNQGMGWYATEKATGEVGSGYPMATKKFYRNKSHRDAVGQQFVWK